MQETVQTLTKARDDTNRDLADVDRQIAKARLHGNRKALLELRDRRIAALRDVDEIHRAINLAEENEAAEAAVTEADVKKVREQRVGELRAKRLNAATEIDRAFSNLERAVADYQELGRELGLLTKTGTAITRKESQNMRWSLWASAERTAALLCVPFANGHRRKTLAQLEGGK